MISSINGRRKSNLRGKAGNFTSEGEREREECRWRLRKLSRVMIYENLSSDARQNVFCIPIHFISHQTSICLLLLQRLLSAFVCSVVSVFFLLFIFVFCCRTLSIICDAFRHDRTIEVDRERLRVNWAWPWCKHRQTLSAFFFSLVWKLIEFSTWPWWGSLESDGKDCSNWKLFEVLDAIEEMRNFFRKWTFSVFLEKKARKYKIFFRKKKTFPSFYAENDKNGKRLFIFFS